LGDLFIESILGKKRPFLILETHSEHLILRLQRRIRESTNAEKKTSSGVFSANDLAVHFLENKDGHTQVTTMDLDINGGFIDPWPDNFFELDFHERMGGVN
jgi:predicted ATPase